MEPPSYPRDFLTPDQTTNSDNFEYCETGQMSRIGPYGLLGSRSS